MSYLFKEEDSHPRHKESRDVENVLVLQGGGSLGAFACGVFKALVKKNVRIDIVAGTSIGAVNAAIIVGSKTDHPEKELENFWMEIAESSPNMIPDIFVFDYDTNAAMFGVPKMFTPVWWRWPTWSHDDADNNKIFYNRNKTEWSEHYYDFLYPRNWTYFYDHSPLAKTLEKYIDYKKLNLAAKEEELPE